MKLNVYYSPVVIFLLCSSNSKQEVLEETLPASLLHPFGRHLYTADKHIELISSGVHMGFTFKGTTCSIYAYINNENGHNYLQYELDGKYQKRIKVSGKDRQPIVITASKSGSHKVWIYKATEAHSGSIFIEKISGNGLEALQRPKMPLIEFIGNSITCGAASDPSEVPCGTGVYHDQHNAYQAYGPRVARALNANFILSSVSGIGIYRNWNSDGPTMPQVYESVDFQASSHRIWNFSAYRPDVVSIALGTNDYSNGDGKRERLPFDSAIFVDSYIKFVQLVKSKYPDAQIALLGSPMVRGDRGERLKRCLSAVKGKIDGAYPQDKPVSLFFFKPMEPKGCTGHPSIEDHAVLAEELRPFFKALLN
jgi:lysophospholipase L1-like esterase